MGNSIVHIEGNTLKAINSEIICMCGRNSDITILPNVNMLQYILNVVGAKLKVSFEVPNSLASVLSFNRNTYGVDRHASEQLVNIMCKLHSGTLQHSIFIPAWYTSSSCLQFLPQMSLLGRNMRSNKQFNLSPGNCRCHFNSVSVANGSTRKATRSTWRGIDYTFSSS